MYPYLLGKAKITRPNQVWAADITYLPMARGFLYLVAVMDWHSRYVVSWRLSNTLEAGFCIEALSEAMDRGRPEVFNTDQGSQFTSQEFTQVAGAVTHARYGKRPAGNGVAVCWGAGPPTKTLWYHRH